MCEKIVCYFRVSTKKQGESGLGLDGQRADARKYAESINASLLAEYTEVESGKRKDRPELAKAIAHARRSKARLVIAKLDRLARNVAFTSALMESKLDFVACDNPHATRLTIHILAAVAEDEARRISERTRSALAAAKRRGKLLGSARPGHWHGREAARRRGAERGAKAATASRTAATNDAYADLGPRIVDLIEGHRTLQAVADILNEEGQTTRRGKAWSATQVGRVYSRYARD